MRGRRVQAPETGEPIGDTIAVTGVLVKRFLPIMILAFAIAAYSQAAPAQPAAEQCWLSAMSDTQKRDLVLGYAEIERTEGKARAAAWAQEQKDMYEKKSVAEGMCPPSRTVGKQAPAPAGGPQQEPQILNRYGKPCKRIELENQNVPNVGGSMGWALLPVCKD